MANSPPKIAVIGAGISGLTCARRMQDRGATVEVFEKARGPGGRITTRRSDSGRFDHGAQFFTAHSPAFVEQVRVWSEQGVAAPWQARFARWSPDGFDGHQPHRTRWVGTPRMSAIGRHMAQDLNVHLSTRIVDLSRDRAGYILSAEDGLSYGPYAVVILSCPGPQASDLLPLGTSIQQLANQLQYAACWAVMVDFAAPISLPYDGIHWSHPLFAWSARDSSKPGRAAGERWVIHTQPTWSDAHMDESAMHVGQVVAEQWRAITSSEAIGFAAHRWRYSLASAGGTEQAYFDAERAVGLCGDGLAGARVEDAWMSGRMMAKKVIAALELD